MKISLGENVKLSWLCICFYFIIIFLLLVVAAFLFCFLFENMYIEGIYEKYEIKIPMGPFDAKFGGGERYLYNEEVRLETLYYAKDLTYLIKKYNFKSTDDEIKEFNNLKEILLDKLNTDNRQKAEEYLSSDFQSCYYKFIENEKGILLLIYIKRDQIIYCIEIMK